MVKCVSAENLLYVSEVIQFMRDLTKKYDVKATSIQLQTYFDQYKIPKILPKSAIMTNIDATSIRFLRLCEKYILEQSEFEINISHKNRKNLVNIYRLLENKINEMNPKINKLANFFGDDSQLVASRRASQTLTKRRSHNNNNNNITPSNHTKEDIHVEQWQTDDENGMSDMDDNKSNNNIKRGHHAQQSSNKISHDCVEDFQLLSNTDDIIQKIYDYLCYTLGDVYTNLNDGCMRFMQTDVYFRWYDNNFKKEKILQEEEEIDDDDSTDDENQNNTKNNNNLGVNISVSPKSGSNEETEEETEEEEKRPMKGSASK